MNTISEQDALSMQFDAVAEPAAVEAQPPSDQPETVETVDKKPLTLAGMFDGTFSSCKTAVMITVGLADSDRFGSAQTKMLSSFSAPEPTADTYNLYNPFRKGSKGPDDSAPAGILRNAIEEILHDTSLLASSKLLFLGNVEQVRNALTKATTAVAASCTADLVFDPDTILATYTAEAEGEVDEHILFSDVVRVTGWPLMNWAQPTAVSSHDMVFNFYVNSGYIYDTEDKLKAIRLVESMLLRAGSNADPEGLTTLMMCVNLSTADIARADIRELLGLLLEDEGYQLFTRQQMLDNYNDFEFLPKSKKQINELVLNPRCPSGDLLLAKIINATDQPSKGE